ncbi:MAG: hypothetical protein L3J83_10230 [Proteobacteria bacterium]|nr:hypothetical protein [Pseudomonadota bacterium]
MNSGITFKNSVCALLVLFSGIVTAQDVAVNITTPPTSFTPGTSQTNAYVFTVGKPIAGGGGVMGMNVTATFDIVSNLTGITWTSKVS